MTVERIDTVRLLGGSFRKTEAGREYNFPTRTQADMVRAAMIKAAPDYQITTVLREGSMWSFHAVKAFDPNQPRDEMGRWTSGGGGAAGGDKGGGNGSGAQITPSKKPLPNTLHDHEPTMLEQYEAGTGPLTDERMHQTIDRYLTPTEQREMRDLEAHLKSLPQSDTLNTTDGAGYPDGANEANWTPERLALHDQLHKEMFANSDKFRPVAGERPEFLILGGRGGSGKSNFEKGSRGDQAMGTGFYDRENYLTINSDEIKESLIRAEGKYLNGDGEPDLQYAALYHAEASYLVDKFMNEARGRGYNVVLDATMKSDQSALIQKYKDRGYKTGAAYLFFPPDKAVASALKRWKAAGPGKRGRYVPPKVTYNSRTNEKSFRSATKIVDRWVMWERGGSLETPTFTKKAENGGG